DVILKTTTILLDENGSFSTGIDFSHEGFVYVENENNNQHNPPATWVFYAEPGDSVSFESKGTELPWNTTISGTRAEEQRLIQDIRTKIRLFDDNRKTRWSNEIFDRDAGHSFRIDSETTISAIIEKLLQAIQDAEKIISEYRQKIPERSFQFILNETKAYFYNGIYSYGIFVYRGYFDFQSGIPVSEDLATIKKIDTINIHEVYNDYGLHSRKCIDYYFGYHFYKANKVRYHNISGSIISTSREPEMDLQVLRMVLTGGPLYREIGKRFIEILENRAPYYSPFMSHNYLYNFALNNLDLMLRRCNDSEVVEKINEILLQYQNLQNEKYIPRIDFVDIDSNRVSFKDFLGDKPTIFYFSSDWIGYRYSYDEAGKAMPEINFVMVTEGNNFRHWKDYTNRAEPVITHLIYLEGEKPLREIFQNQQVHIVFNKKGEIVDYASNPNEAARLALNSLTQKKELNSSQLKTIIAILGFLLVIIVIILILWKWRVRKRFHQEEQKRRLRELELTAIRSQMNPHFLFNCLNSVQNLVQKNMNREAHLYLADFAGLIRKVLQNSEKEEVPLAEELEMVRQYLNLEKLRFDFDFDISVERDIDVNNTMVPSMLFQPFAENAIIHGLQNKEGNRELKIEINRDLPDEVHEVPGIVISIEDNGIGREASKNLGEAKNGKGSKLLKERLEILSERQKERYHLEIIDLKDNGANGTRVQIFIPEEK
ncbi:MAG: histidine kinase, partial [Prolixibacteraceae bacterium]|nr:histidine kinase [Prolixibacteraceae bacterium]